VQKFEEEKAGTTTLTVIPPEQKLQNFLRGLQTATLDDGLVEVGTKVTPESTEQYASTHGLTSVDRNRVG
jgi:hypothetical protein